MASVPSKEIVDPWEIPSTEVLFQHNDYRQVLNCERYPKVKEKYNIRFPPNDAVL